MKSSVAEVLRIVRRRAGSGHDGQPNNGIRMSGTRTQTLTNIEQDTQLGDPIGRQGNDYLYPDLPRGATVINQDPGDRLQDFANTHLSEGPNPGRIPRFWNDRRSGKVGRGITGDPAGDNFLALAVTGQSDNGMADAKFIMHVQIPRGSTMARAYARTVDDAANIPGVYVSDPGRR